MDVKQLVNWIRVHFRALAAEPKYKVVSRTPRNILKSQKNWGWKRPSSPLPRQGYIELFAQDSVQLASEYLQGLHNLQEPLPKLGHPHSKIKSFLMFRGNLLHVSLCLLLKLLKIKLLRECTQCPFSSDSNNEMFCRWGQHLLQNRVCVLQCIFSLKLTV